MRILHAIGGLADHYGGPSNALVGLSLAQSAQGNAVSIIAVNRDGDITSRDADLHRARINVIRVPGRGKLSAPFSRLPHAVTKKVLEAEVVHIHGVWERLLITIAQVAASKKIPVIVRTCGMLDEWALSRKPWKKWLYRKLWLDNTLKKAAALHCTSAFEARSTAKALPRVKIIVEPNGISLDEFRELPPRGDFRRRYGLSDSPLITFLGRLYPGKGVEYLLPALAIMKRQDALLAIVGPDTGPFADAMKRDAYRLGLTSRVIFTGMLRGSARIPPLVDADLFALPSEHENFGVAIAEALAAGCPAIVSEHVGLADEVTAHGLGQSTTLDKISLAAALDAWLDDPERRSRVGTQARAFAFKAFDWSEIAHRWRAHYSSSGVVAQT